MFIEKLKIKNFLTISEGELNLNNRGLVLISGVNKDDTSAQSNGAGKSSLVDAICWCLFGSTARGESADDVVNNVAGKDCCVQLVIHDNQDIYEIHRYRKDTINKSAVFIWFNGTNISGPTLADNDSKICQLIGMTKEIFQATVYCGQDNMPYLPAMTDKQIKELIENAAGLTQLQRAYNLAKEQRQDHQTTSLSLTSVIENIKYDIKNFENDIEVLKNERAIWKAQHESDIHVKEVELELRKQRFTDDVNKFKAQYDKSIEEQIKSLNAQINSPERLDLEAQLKQAEMNRVSKNFEVNTMDNTIKNKESTFETNEREIQEIRYGVKSKCPTCGRTFAQEDINAAVAHLKTENDNLLSEIEEDKKTMVSLGVQYQIISDKIQEIKSKMPDVSQTLNELNRLNAINIQQKQNMLLLQNRKNEILNFNKEIEAFKVMENPKQISLQSVQKMLENKKNELKQKELDSQAVLKQLTIDNNLVSVFGPSGVRAHILDVITPFLNAKTNKYLHTLSCGNLMAEWSTLSVTKSNVVKEKFSIKVTNKTGAKTYKSLSGGEKRKVNLACILALQDLATTRADKSFNLWIGDEIDDALDIVGLELLMSVLNEKAQEKGTVLIISHNDLKDWISQNIIVTKQNKVSTIQD